MMSHNGCQMSFPTRAAAWAKSHVCLSLPAKMLLTPHHAGHKGVHSLAISSVLVASSWLQHGAGHVLLPAAHWVCCRAGTLGLA